MLHFRFFFVIQFFLIITVTVKGQDSTKSYNLKQITVKSTISIEPKPTTSIDSLELSNFDGASLFEIAKYVPSVKAQTNSRGESLFYLRGSNERQLGLFLDGNLLNIPWDNRIDLSLLPTNSISKLTIIKGVPSSVYGANNISGVILAESEQVTNKSLSGKLTSLLGANNYKNIGFSIKQKIKNFSFLVSSSFFNRDAFSLPSQFSSSENPQKARINSALQTIGIFAKGSYHYQNSSIVSLSIGYLNSEKYVPPEINVDKPRYWRYPLWKNFSLALFGKHSFNYSNNSFLEYSFSIYNFRMDINQYNDLSYSSIKQIEKDNDYVFTGRLIYTTLFTENSILRISANGFSTEHTESFLSTGFQKTEYQQLLYSTGAEYELLLSNFTFIGGLSYDGTSVLKSGNFSSGNPLSDFGINGTVKYKLTNQITGQINIGRKSRFPSLRESYSDGLGRFVRNPLLKSENVTDTEIGFEYTETNSKVFLNFIYIMLNNGIVRTVVTTESGNKFMRINKGEIRTYGFEFEGSYQVNREINSGFSFSYLNSFGKNENGEFKDTLEYRPNLYANFFLSVNLYKHLIFLAEANSIANEFSLQNGNKNFQKLPSYIVVNARLSYSFAYNKKTTFSFIIRVNNIFDKLYYTQLGLPEAGRELFGGIKILF